MKLVPENINEAIKHLTPRSKEELAKWPKMIITNKDIQKLKKLSDDDMWHAMYDFSFDAKYEYLKLNRENFEPGKSYFRMRPGILDDLMVQLIKSL